ncbi:MAG: hypothetical protein V4733_12215 [Verrucomicrobiota bacterium]
MPGGDSNLEAAERVAVLLAENEVPTVVIGAVALAAYGYIRTTYDIDLGVDANVPKMRKLAVALVEIGFAVEFHEPDADDPLCGVIDVSGPFGLVQIISFADRFPAAIRDALADHPVPIRPASPLSLIPIPQLVALKLYSGGSKDKADIVELLRRNPDCDLNHIRLTCLRYRIGGMDAVLEELG